jgi:hypothetical protein
MRALHGPMPIATEDVVSPISRGRGGRRRPTSMHHQSRRPVGPSVVFAVPDPADPKGWALPAATGTHRGIDLSLLDRDDEDDRHIFIEAEHPLFADALRSDHELEVGGEAMNPRLHIAMHEIVINQLWHQDPPDVWPTARRLSALGYDRHVVLHMIASIVSQDLWQIMHEGQTPNLDEYSRQLDRLPEGWPPPGKAAAH